MFISIYMACVTTQNKTLWVMKNTPGNSGKESKEEQFLKREGNVEEKNHGRKKGKKGGGE